VLSDRVKKKKYLYDSYKAQLDSMEDIGWMPENEWAQPNHWLSCITLPDRISPTKIIGLLADENIEARPTWKPMHLQPYYRGYGCMGGKVSEDLFTRGICLPSDTKMSDQDIERVVDVVRKAWKLT
jgi:dTDP-4-amino-4,6-dideoxygalactose transaminase